VTYRPALDGLRALAVMAVLLYHGGVSATPGGFLGVDLFFVLSGFLITTLLLLEIEGSGEVRLSAFWGRRARRLLPALFLVLLAVAIYAAWVGGEQARSIRLDALATLFYVSNWWFIASGNSYFEQFQDPSPLTHTWSLAIEEQWYLLLPIALVLLPAAVRTRSRLAVGFAAIGAVSVVIMWLSYSPGTDPSRAYYGTDTRLQALLVGAVLACLFTPGVIERFRPAARVAAPLGLIAVLGFFLVVSESDEWLYRGGFLLIAIAGVALLAGVVSHPEGVVATVLSLGPVVWVGRISYGLYLWHWPVYIVLSPGRTGMSGTPLLLLRLAVTFGIAAASYYLVEMPIRRGGLSRLSPVQRSAVVLAAPVAILAVLALSTVAARPAAPDSLEAIRDSASRTPTPSPPPIQASPSADRPVRAMLIGDSIALSLFSAYQPGSVPGLEVLPGTEFGCGLVPFEASLNGVRQPIRPECVEWDRQRESRIAASGADLAVVFVGPWEQYDRWIDGRPVPYTEPEWRWATVAAYENVLRESARHSGRIALVLNTCHGAPELDLPDAVLYQAGRYPDVVNDPSRISAVNDAAREAVRRSGLDVTVIDPAPYLCQGGEYRSEISGVPLHTDGIHFTEAGARLYWEWLGPRVLESGR